MVLHGCLIFCGALPVALVIFLFFLQHRSGCARQTGENWSRRTGSSSEGGGYSCSCSVFFLLSLGRSLDSSFSFCTIEVGSEEWDLAL